jgi:hypothetical protein
MNNNISSNDVFDIPPPEIEPVCRALSPGMGYTYVSFDLETTGLSKHCNKSIDGAIPFFGQNLESNVSQTQGLRPTVANLGVTKLLYPPLKSIDICYHSKQFYFHYCFYLALKIDIYI